MGNQENKSDKQNIIISYKTSDRIPKEIKNRFLKRNIKKSDLTHKDLEILNCLFKPKEAYYCNYCSSFPLISFSLDKKEKITLTLLEHNCGKNKFTQYISHTFKDDELRTAFNIRHKTVIELYMIQTLIKDKYIENIPDDLLPFESMEDFHEFLKVVIKYKELKEKIAFYNNGDTTFNKVFTFFEFILNVGLYGFGTLYEYLNALSISDFLKFEVLEQYNCGCHMKNMDLIYQLKSFELKQVTNIVKLNDDYLFAFIIDINYKFSDYPENIVGIFIETFDTKYKYISSILYLKLKETDKLEKNIIIQYDNKNYKNIIELETDKYLLHVDNKYSSPNLLIVKYSEEFKKYDFKLLYDWICLLFLKLKSKEIFILCKNNIYLMKYEFSELNILREC